VFQGDKGLPVNVLGLERIFYPQNGVIPLESIKSHDVYHPCNMKILIEEADDLRWAVIAFLPATNQSPPEMLLLVVSSRDDFACG
jgi:hypothetical protein